MKTTLVILAAGIGSRFGGGVKQLTPVGPGGELIIDYSVHDAIAAGFDRIVFIIRRDIEADFREIIGDRIEAVCRPLGVEIRYAFQELTAIPGTVPEGRTKPWGTGHAVLCCNGLLDGPFAVINADDYYGREGFRMAAQALAEGRFALVGYVLENTLSENGAVTRGICSLRDGDLVGIDETRGIEKTPEGARAGDRILDPKAVVSMNFWCFPLSFLDTLREGFPAFLCGMTDPLKDEYLLPVIADAELRAGTRIAVLASSDRWFGITYWEDSAAVAESFAALHRDGVYADPLFGDLCAR